MVNFFKKIKRVSLYGLFNKVWFKYTYPISPNVWLVNFFFQRILRINGEFDWMIHFTSRATGKIQIGEKVWESFAISGGCYFQGINGIFIGDNTMVAPNVCIISANHSKNDFSKWEKDPPIKIGANCWIGAGAKILPGVQLGDRVIVGAGAVVTKSFPEGSIVGGVPAKIIMHYSNV